MMVEVEVRCCCTPTKLYGWLQVPAEKVRRGRMVQLVRCITADECRSAADADPVSFHVDTWTLSFEEFLDHGEWRIALKADGDDRTPEQKLEFLRTLREFTEAEP